MFAAERAPWQNPRILSTLSLVFLAGALAGALVMQFCVHHRAPRAPRAELTYERLKTELNLTPVQAQKMKTMLDDFVRYYHELQVQLEDTGATGKNNIMSMLDPEQKKKFERICSDLQRK